MATDIQPHKSTYIQKISHVCLGTHKSSCVQEMDICPQIASYTPTLESGSDVISERV